MCWTGSNKRIPRTCTKKTINMCCIASEKNSTPISSNPLTRSKRIGCDVLFLHYYYYCYCYVVSIMMYYVYFAFFLFYGFCFSLYLGSNICLLERATSRFWFLAIAAFGARHARRPSYPWGTLVWFIPIRISRVPGLEFVWKDPFW